jgi:hypothetical protein
MVAITYFYERLALDVDNLPKPILDALKGLVYVDDTQITDVVCRKRDLRRTFRVANPSSALTDGLSRGQDFLYIVITEAPDHEVLD